MDSFDYSDEALQPGTDSASLIWNILTIIVLLMTLCVCAFVSWFMIDPQNSLNPYKPPTMPEKAKFPTATPTPKPVLPPTWTPTPTVFPTQTPQPTNTALPTNTQPVVTPTLEVPAQTPGNGQPTETPGEGQVITTPTDGMPFVLQPGDPVAIDNIGHQELGCNWMGVAGRAFDLTGAPIEQGLLVQLGGELNNEPVENLGMVGMVSIYGPGGYEFELGEQAVASTQTLWVQLLDQAMLPLSDKIYFDTFSECDKNLILINFNQVR